MKTEKQRKDRREWLLNLLPVFSFIGLFGIWFWVNNYSSGLVPSPLDVWNRLLFLLANPVGGYSLLGHILSSFRRVFIGLICGVLFGLSFGTLLGLNKTARQLFQPLYYMLRPIPPIAWIPLISVWFGVGELSKYIIVFLGAIHPVILNTFAGMKMLPQLNVNVGKIFGAKGLRRLAHVVFPSALPAIFAGIKTSIGGAWVVILAAEMVSAKSGLGFLIIRGNDSADLALVMTAMVFIGVIGAILTYIASNLERWLCPWMRERN